MSAQDHLQPQQLAMFMTPTEVGELHSGDYKGKVRDAFSQVRKNADKYWEPVAGKPIVNHVDELTKKVEAAGGIETPITVLHPHPLSPRQFPALLANGHHRATLAHETNRLIPVNHIEHKRML